MSHSVACGRDTREFRRISPRDAPSRRRPWLATTQRGQHHRQAASAGRVSKSVRATDRVAAMGHRRWLSKVGWPGRRLPPASVGLAAESRRPPRPVASRCALPAPAENRSRRTNNSACIGECGASGRLEPAKRKLTNSATTSGDRRSPGCKHDAQGRCTGSARSRHGQDPRARPKRSTCRSGHNLGLLAPRASTSFAGRAGERCRSRARWSYPSTRSVSHESRELPQRLGGPHARPRRREDRASADVRARAPDRRAAPIGPGPCGGGGWPRRSGARPQAARESGLYAARRPEWIGVNRFASIGNVAGGDRLTARGHRRPALKIGDSPKLVIARSRRLGSDSRAAR